MVDDVVDVLQDKYFPTGCQQKLSHVFTPDAAWASGDTSYNLEFWPVYWLACHAEAMQALDTGHLVPGCPILLS